MITIRQVTEVILTSIGGNQFQGVVGTPLQGSCLFLVIAAVGADLSYTTISDNLGGEIIPLGANGNPGGAALGSGWSFFRENWGGGDLQVTIQMSAGASSVSCILVEMSKAPLSGCLLDYTTILDTSSPYVAAPLTPSEARSMMVAVLYSDEGAAGLTYAESTGYSIVAQRTLGGNAPLCVAVQYLTSSSPQAPSFTTTGGGTTGKIVLAAFRDDPAQDVNTHQGANRFLRHFRRAA